MPCDHKFQNHLNLHNIDFEPTTLIVGTFNPAWPASNLSEWFCGNTKNNSFWDVLPRLYGAPSLLNASASDWKQFCRDKQIAVTDLISSIDDADQDDRGHNKILSVFADKAIAYNFDDFTFVNIVQILKSHPTIKNVYLTRGITESFWRHLWNPVMKYCAMNDLHEQRLISPSEEVGYPHKAYNNEHPDAPITELNDYILMRWKEQWRF